VGHERVLSAFCDNRVAALELADAKQTARCIRLLHAANSNVFPRGRVKRSDQSERSSACRCSALDAVWPMPSGEFELAHMPRDATQGRACTFLSHEIGAPACTDIAQVCLIIKQEKRCLYFILILGLCAFCLLPFARSRRRSSREGDIQGPRKTVFSNPSCGPGHSEVYRCFSTRNARRVR
jgi:hypothetical protein